MSNDTNNIDDNYDKLNETLSSLDNINWNDSITISVSNNSTASSNMYSSNYYSNSNYNYNIGGINATGSIGSYPNITITDNTSSALHVDGDLILKGRNLNDILDKIEKRLSILVPNPKKLEKYEALKKAYEHYKTLESLVDEVEEE